MPKRMCVIWGKLSWSEITHTHIPLSRMQPAQCVREVHLSGKKGAGLVMRVPGIVWDEVIRHKWNVKPDKHTKYAMAKIDGKMVFAHRHIYKLLVQMDRKPPLEDGLVIDHKNGDGLDNSEDNLHAVTTSTNNQKARKRVIKNSKRLVCPFIGVSQSGNRWAASYKGLSLGTHINPGVAACWYDAAVRLDGQGGKTNFEEEHPEYPLSESAKKRLANTPKSYEKVVGEQCISKRGNTYSVIVRKKYVGCLPTLEEARIFRDLAQQQDVDTAKQLIAQVYY